MANKWLFEAVDRTLRDIRKTNAPFGGVVTVLAGDWRQILPVVPGGTRADIVGKCLKRSPLWSACSPLAMVTNMRARLAGGETAEHAAFLLEVGNGTLPTHENVAKYGDCRIQIPDRYLLSSKRLSDLIEFVFGGMADGHERWFLEDGQPAPLFHDAAWLCSRAILAPKNADVDRINDEVLKLIPGEAATYLSSNYLREDDENNAWSPELLASLRVTGWPPHKLKLKHYSAIMLIRNLDPAEGHVNGARYQVTALRQKTITARRASDGAEVTIPRIDFHSDKDRYPFNFCRRQFPIRLAFGITTNKSQGQTLAKAGLWLPSQLFSHGQLYVALSRVGHPDNIRVLVEGGTVEGKDGTHVDNVVYHEILN